MGLSPRVQRDQRIFAVKCPFVTRNESAAVVATSEDPPKKNIHRHQHQPPPLCHLLADPKDPPTSTSWGVNLIFSTTCWTPSGINSPYVAPPPVASMSMRSAFGMTEPRRESAWIAAKRRSLSWGAGVALSPATSASTQVSCWTACTTAWESVLASSEAVASPCASNEVARSGEP
eukprot:365025-Chlamydomonas_euryale.AAC.7